MAEQTGKAKSELTESEKSKAADEEALESLSHECAEAHASWEARQTSAAEEMKVIEKAKSILVSNVRVFFVQTGKGKGAKSIVDFGADWDPDTPQEDDKTSGQRQRVVAKLKELSRTFQGYALMDMVGRAKVDPFEKIKGLISDMVAKLMTEANEEATQKSF